MQTPTADAVWELLGEYEPWITTAVKTDDPHRLSAFDVKPLLVLTEECRCAGGVFFNARAGGRELRLFGSGAYERAPRRKTSRSAHD